MKAPPPVRTSYNSSVPEAHNETSHNALLGIGFEIPFDKIKPEQVEPACQALIENARAAIRAISEHSGPRTYANTLGALDAATEALETAITVVGHLESVASTPELRDAYNKAQPEVSAFFAGIPLDAELWRALKAYSETDDAKALTGPKKRFLEKTIDDFKRNGADLDHDGKKRLEELTREFATLTNKYAQNIVEATKAYELIIEDEKKLAGLPPSAIEAARESAKSKNKEGWRFTLQAPSYIAVMTYLDDASIREEMYRAYNRRATEGELDNTKLIARILELRAEKARLLGKRDFADFVLADRMAKNGNRAKSFVADLTEKTRRAFEKENEELNNFRRKKEGGEAKAIEPWDVAYYAEKMRQELYDFDEEELRPYFPVDRVLAGMFEIAGRLYGIQIEERKNLPVWSPAVRAYDIFDEDRHRIGAFYSDVYPREEKRGGAWMNGLMLGLPESSGRFSPHLALICANVTPPIGDKPALLTHEEVETMFHEFGHLLHHCLSKVEVRSLGGTNVAWDFVELPSQIMENWCWEKEALDLFARHHETGALIPDELFNKMKRARTFRAANAMMRQLGFAQVDLSLHVDYSPQSDGPIVEYSRNLMQQYAPAPYKNDYAFIAAFGHLFSSEVGYAAGYYSYKWAEVLDADAFTRFKADGIFSREAGRAFQKNILERGNGADPAELYRTFMGRDPSMHALLERSGLAPKLDAAAPADAGDKKKVFQNRDVVQQQLDLPNIVFYSFVGDTSDKYRNTIESIITRVVGVKNIRRRHTQPSAGGKYTAYRFDVFHERFEDVEQIYREVGSLPETRFVL